MDVVNATQDYLNGNGASNPFFVAFDEPADLASLFAEPQMPYLTWML